MKLLEHVGKDIFKENGIDIPVGIILSKDFDTKDLGRFLNTIKDGKVIIKAQVIGGKRKKSGLVEKAESFDEAIEKINDIFSKRYNNSLIKKVLVEEMLDIEAEYFLSILYDTESRKPMILFSKSGGIDIEENEKPESITVDILEGLQDKDIQKLVEGSGLDCDAKLVEMIKRSYLCFIDNDCRNLEINPIIRTSSGDYIAADAKVTIDDSGILRQEKFKDIEEDESSLNDREKAARRIDQEGDKSHRGSTGKTYIDIEGGEIAVLASGGGASLVAMDAIIEAGGKPANYTEYSGNPSREKVRRLTELTLSKEGLKGCLVIGGKANFTDIFETLSGFMDVIMEIKPRYPIVIRRAGPRDKEAFEMIRKVADEQGFDITLYGEEIPMSKAAHIMVQKIGDANA
ncbi:hypothetical protein H6503_04005 [Candidatus Woesearchaeota archaeon]|nr:hypothetical protein [Candidatus Woesearchaeota archaeon]